MFVGTFKETVDGESRVAISPESCKKLSNLGYTILIEKDAGVNSSFSNLSYESAGAKLIDNKFDIINQVDILLSVTSIPDDKIIEKSKQNLIIVGTFDTYENYKTLQSLAKKKINVISLDLLPRISRAQSSK